MDYAILCFCRLFRRRNTCMFIFEEREEEDKEAEGEGERQRGGCNALHLSTLSIVYIL